MKKLLITGVFLLAALFIAGAQQGFAYQQVTSTPSGGCLNCHAFAGGTSSALHTTHASVSGSCNACHVQAGAKDVMSAKCIVCHPSGNVGKCNLINLPAHPTSGAQSCLTCHATECSAPAECIDADNDTYGANCPAGPDCDDTDNTTHTGCCIDTDNDTYGENCPAGPDCDDTDDTKHDDCEIDCTLQITPKTFSVLRATLSPFQFFTIRADRQSSISFSNPICIFWESEGIDDVIKIRIGEKLIIGYIRVWPTHLTAGDFKVYVTFGDIDETQCGPITVKDSGASSSIASKRVKVQKSCGN